jgi:hypothetical protein
MERGEAESDESGVMNDEKPENGRNLCSGYGADDHEVLTVTGNHRLSFIR